MAFDPSTAQLIGFDPSTARLESEAQVGGPSTADTVSRRDPDVDYATGLKNFGFRSRLSATSNDAERKLLLDKFVGPGNWRKDSFGALVLEPAGLAKLGQRSKLPVAIDEQSASRYDVADVVGDLPAIAGGTAAAMMAARMPGAVVPALAAGGGAALGRGALEAFKAARGEQATTPGGLAETIGTDFAAGAVGEAGTRLLKPLGRFILGPESRRMTPEKEAALKSATDLGFTPRPGQVTDAPILARWESLTKTIFGDLNEEANDAAAKAAIAKLRPGTLVSPAEAGEAFRTALVTGRRALSDEAAKKYAAVDAMAQTPVIPTVRLKLAAAEILESLPKTTGGKPVMTSGETTGYIKDLLDLPDNIGAGQMQQVRSVLGSASKIKQLTPELSDRHVGLLHQAADKTFDDALASGRAPAGVIAALRDADTFYKAGISKFDNRLAQVIARDPGKAGALEPELVVDALIKPGQATQVARMKAAVPPEAWAKVRDAHAEKLLASVVQHTDDPLKMVFNGRALKEELLKHGDDTLTAVHGSRWAAQIKEFADALMLTQKGGASGSGGLVAAHTALNPIVNMPKLAALRGLARLFQQPGTLHYLTVGVKAPRTREGVEALTRVAMQAQALVRDETGVSPFVVTPPPRPEE